MQIEKNYSLAGVDFVDHWRVIGAGICGKTLTVYSQNLWIRRGILVLLQGNDMGSCWFDGWEDAGYVGIPMSENKRLILENWWWCLELKQMVEQNGLEWTLME
ncbi:hypothetical protein MKW98_023490 [Papaver atlanticum]|uniref:Uncharacterized protein n=1 Tax=Papaver atlanticum TaxID=357466 RepID=A0AAD4XMC4_9MAGN|nr:hypothetical protein MKW98_023490 [Papaver atlanticum]